EVFQAIIRGSVERQYRVGIALREQRGERVLIVGGAGGMGNWWRGFLELVGHSVDLADPALGSVPPAPGRFAGLDEVEDLDLYAAVLVAVPLGHTARVLDQLTARQPQGMVVEIASIKEPLYGPLARARESGVRTYEPLTFVLAAQGEPADEKKALEPLLSHPYSRLVVVPFSHHDRLMGWLLGLGHLTNMLFGAALTRSGIEPEELCLRLDDVQPPG